jgi:peptidoglycan DL-endopeptidase LytE
MNRSVLCFFLTIACLYGCAGTVFPQSTAKSLKRKRTPTKGVTAATRKSIQKKYTVTRGDSLYRIATSHGTTVTALKAANPSASDRLRVGQTLVMPESKKADSVAADGAYSRPKPPAKSTILALAQDSLNPTASPDPEMLETPGAVDLAAIPELSGSEDQPLRYQLASAGFNFLGVRYRWSGTSEISGFDCSGFVKTLFEKFKISLPRSSREQYKVGQRVSRDDLEVGDLVFFSSRGKVPSHVGVYVGDNMFLHAARKARQVLASSLVTPWYSKRFLGARRLLGLWTDEPKPDEETK